MIDKNKSGIVTKTEIADVITENMKIKPGVAKAVIDMFQEIIIDELGNGNQVRISGLGTFKTKQYPARNYRTVNTGELVEKPAARRVRFTAHARLKETVK